MTKIAFWRTVGGAFGFVFSDLGRFLQVSGIWLASIISLELLAISFRPDSHGLAVTFCILGFMTFLAASLALSFAWHRTILAQETPSAAMALRFGAREWRFLGYSLLIVLVICVPMVIFILISALISGIFLGVVMAANGANAAAVGGTGALMGRIIAAIFMLAAWYVVSRLWLALPAVATDQRGDMLSTAWRRSRRNGLRLMFGLLVCALPFSLVNGLIQRALGAPIWTSVFDPAHHPLDSSLLIPSVTVTLILLVDFIQTAVWVAFLSFSFHQLSASSAAPSSGMLEPHLVPAE
jgi:hypothetical protein